MLLDRLSAVRILAMLQQLKADPTLLRKLLTHGYRDTIADRIDVNKWIRMQNAGHDVWRLKVTDLEQNGQKFRVIYTFANNRKSVHILAIKPRFEINYDDPSDALASRIVLARSSLR